MGALRAAELAEFGMKGVGVIYEAFRSGEFEDDDEVTIAHGDQNSGYRATSEAMVNIRATLFSAEHAGVLAPNLRERLVCLAKDLFYPDRSYPRLFERAREEGLPRREMEMLQTFVRSKRIDQKRADAVALLQAVGRCCEVGAPPPPVKFTFAHTEAWGQVVEWAETQPSLSQTEGVSAGLLAAEVRISGLEGRAVLATGMNRAAAGMLARLGGVTFEQQQLQALDRAHRKAMGLDGIEGNESQLFDRWLSEHGLTPDGYRAFLEREAQFQALQERFHDEVDRHVVDELRVNATYTTVSQRARDKQQVLADHGLDEPTLTDVGLSAQELVNWYFSERLGCPVPQNFDAFLRQIGIASIAALQREALRELLYQRLRVGGSGA
jgi:hypothetical protein